MTPARINQKPFMKFVAITAINVTLILGSCDPTATFDKPQPDNEKSLASFPNRLQGNYLAGDQGSVVAISDNL